MLLFVHKYIDIGEVLLLEIVQSGYVGKSRRGPYSEKVHVSRSKSEGRVRHAHQNHTHTTGRPITFDSE
jgi:hypothetical protein